MNYSKFLRSIGSNIKRIRKQERGYSKNKLSNKSEVPWSKLDKLEKGELENFEMATIRKIAEALEVDISEIFKTK